MTEDEARNDLAVARELLETLNRLKAAGYWDDELLQRARVLDGQLGHVYRQLRYGDGPRNLAGTPPRLWWPWWREQVLNVIAAIEAGTVRTGNREGGAMTGEGYDVGQVCLNGHPISGSTQHLPQFSKKHCDKCGAETITQCPACDEPIRGDYWGGFSTKKYEAPAYCHNCGKAYPWTRARLKAAKDLALEAENLSDEEREQLAGSLDDIIADTPRTQLAASRFKRLVGKAGKGTAQAMRDIVVDIASETAKKAIF